MQNQFIKKKNKKNKKSKITSSFFILDNSLLLHSMQ